MPAENSGEDKPVEINKWDTNSVKHSLDDAVKKAILERHEYVENHSLVDGRLTISTVAVGLALWGLLWDWLYPFPQSRPVLILCVVIYFILMGVLQLYTWFVERSIFFVAIDEDPTGGRPDQTWKFSSKLKRFDHNYTLEMDLQSESGGNSHGSITKSITGWIDENGNINSKLVASDVLKLHGSMSPAAAKKRN